MTASQISAWIKCDQSVLCLGCHWKKDNFGHLYLGVCSPYEQRNSKTTIECLFFFRRGAGKNLEQKIWGEIFEHKFFGKSSLRGFQKPTYDMTYQSSPILGEKISKRYRWNTTLKSPTSGNMNLSWTLHTKETSHQVHFNHMYVLNCVSSLHFMWSQGREVPLYT